jgi:hypothetical protein
MVLPLLLEWITALNCLELTKKGQQQPSTTTSSSHVVVRVEGIIPLIIGEYNTEQEGFKEFFDHDNYKNLSDSIIPIETLKMAEKLF